MKNKRFLLFASCTLIFSILACNLPGSGQPDLAATITAQAVELQARNATSTPAPASPADTASPTTAAHPTNPPQPTNPPLPATPSKPQNFKARGSASSIQFTWDDTSLDENGFRIYQDGVSAPIGSLDAHDATGGMSFDWPGLACGFKGKFTVRSYNDAGESGSSNSVTGVTIPCTPMKLLAQGQGNAIHFNWDVGTGTHNEDGFRIYQQGVSQPQASRGPNLGAGGTNYDMTGLACNLVATYFVTAYNSAGESPASNLVQSETVPCGPSGMTITGVHGTTVTYSWTDNATSETGYHVYQNDKLYVTLPSSSPSSLTGAMNSNAFQTCGQTLLYSVTAFNYAGDSTVSEHVGATSPPCP